MGWQATGWAFKAPIESSGCKFVLVALAERAGNEDDDCTTWECFPSINAICKYTAQGYRTVQRHLDWLEANGYISRVQRMQAKGRKGCFTFTLHRFPDTTGQFGQRPEEAPEPAPNGQTEPIKGTGHKDVVLRAPEPFEVWWTIYPRKVAKDDARKAWRQRTADINALGLEELLARTRLYADHVLGKDAEHVAHGATWLRGRRWNDELHPRGGQTDGNRRASGFDHAADRADSRLQAMVEGARQALDGGRRQRWRL